MSSSEGRERPTKSCLDLERAREFEESNNSLSSKLLVKEMDVSRTKIHLDTSIAATSNSEWRERVRECEESNYKR